VRRNWARTTTTGSAPTGVISRSNRRLLGVSAVVTIGALIMAACGSGSGTSGSSGANTTIPGQLSGTSAASGTSATSGSSGTPTTASGSKGATTTTTLPVGSVKGLYGALPPVGTPTKGGVITSSQLTGSTPNYIFPIVPGANASVYTVDEFINNLFLPLYDSPVGGTPTINYQLSLAPKPVFSNGGKTVTITMKQGYKWADGAPVDAKDVLFDIDLIQQAVKASAANWSAFTPGFFPQSLKSISSPSKYTIVMNLKKAYNPSFFLNDQIEDTIFPLPSTTWNVAAKGGPHLDYTKPANALKIYDYLSKAGSQVAGFGTNPLWKDVDGPFALSSFSATNSSYTFVPNPSYGGTPKPSISKFEVDTYTGITPLLTALKTGSLDIGQIDFSQLGDVDGLRKSGYSVYGYPNLGWFGAFFNFKDKTDHFNSIISQLYVRQALAHLEDQPAYLSGIFKNAGVLAYGPVPSVPPTPYTPPDAVTGAYPYSPSAAVALLKAHGWTVKPNGQTVCGKAGSGPTACGAGIPAGTPFKFTWFYIPASETPSVGLESEAFASEAKEAAGINIQLESKQFNFIVSTYNDADPADAKYENDWGVENFGGYTDDIYPTQNSLFNTGGDYNQGGYSDPMADKLINASVFSTNPSAVTNEASYLTKSVPVLFMPNTDYVYAINNKVGGTANGFLGITQFALWPQYFYLNK
jgi:peptide/nickel transport system substrate-binding protein